MSPEEKHLLERAVFLGEENNKILHGIRRGARFGLAWKIFYWILIIAISYGTYVYVQPYVDQLMKVFGGPKGLEKLLNNLPR